MREKWIGNTPLVRLDSCEENEVYMKLEGSNLYGSAKDRAAFYVLSQLMREGMIDKDTEIVESSSGNMGVALAAVGAQMGLKVTIVIDPSISELNEFLIHSYHANTIKIMEADANGSYLKRRLEMVQAYIKSKAKVYWFNQYGNEKVAQAYRETLGKEIIDAVPDVEYIFMAVSSGGTVAGVSEAAKRYSTSAKVIAVDIEGSKIFDPDSKVVKHLTGIGSSICSDNLKRAYIEDKVIVTEREALKGLRDLLDKEQLFLGASSGCVYAGATRYLTERQIKGKKCVMISHDRGERYFRNLYERYFSEYLPDIRLGGEK
ncbi:MAG: pyridoxal-phosphate dependent enzyme [Lachnospiraceae bacterium]|nr:pyridoxal-phosphate dependent enzyme [Robinsoniella sp.]MDY3767844.1 pyridoxal-phosphate dependent enzyme [Lachnospiraceae bacterium]